MLNRKKLSWLIVCVAIITMVGMGIRGAGTLLLLDDPQRSDIIVVLSGDTGDTRFMRALRLLESGYSRDLILDASNFVEYGRSQADLAREYVQSMAPGYASHIYVCSFNGDSTVLELQGVAKCIRAISPGAKSAMIVTSNYHTRRAYSIAQHVFPEYKWSVAAAQDEIFGTAWWRHREWAKTTVLEWEKLCWWSLVERFQKS